MPVLLRSGSHSLCCNCTVMVCASPYLVKEHGVQSAAVAASAAPLQVLSQALIESLPLCCISQLHGFPVSHFHCPLSVLLLLIFLCSITFQHCGSCAGWLPSASPRARCLCCPEQNSVSEHCCELLLKASYTLVQGAGTAFWMQT